MPNLVFLTIASALGYAAWWMKERDRKAKEQDPVRPAEAAQANPEATWDDLQPVDTLGAGAPLVGKARQDEICGLVDLKGKLSHARKYPRAAAGTQSAVQSGPEELTVAAGLRCAPQRGQTGPHKVANRAAYLICTETIAFEAALSSGHGIELRWAQLGRTTPHSCRKRPPKAVIKLRPEADIKFIGNVRPTAGLPVAGTTASQGNRKPTMHRCDSRDRQCKRRWLATLAGNRLCSTR
jgi:hypothetical protein